MPSIASISYLHWNLARKLVSLIGVVMWATVYNTYYRNVRGRFDRGNYCSASFQVSGRSKCLCLNVLGFYNAISQLEIGAVSHDI